MGVGVAARAVPAATATVITTATPPARSHLFIIMTNIALSWGKPPSPFRPPPFALGHSPLRLSRGHRPRVIRRRPVPVSYRCATGNFAGAERPPRHLPCPAEGGGAR